MVRDDGLIIVTSTREANSIRNHGYNLLFFGYKIGERGKLERMTSPLIYEKAYMGICDYNFFFGIEDIKRLCEDILYEAKKYKYLGVVCDFDGICPERTAVIKELDMLLKRNGIPLFVPEKYANYAENSIILIQSAISGGSLENYLNSKIEKYGRERIALELVVSMSRFEIPSRNPSGERLTPAEFAKISKEHNPSFYFSKELCSKYFTYMQVKNGYFVIFDDNSTIMKKIELSNNLGIHHKFTSIF